MDSLINDQLIQELVNRQIQEDKFRPREERSAPETKPLDPKVAMMMGNIADSASTYGFLQQKGRHETNPAMRYVNKSPWTVIPTAVGGAMAYKKLYEVLHDKHPKVADTIAGLIGGWHGAAAGNNVEHPAGGGNRSIVNDLNLSARGR